MPLQGERSKQSPSRIIQCYLGKETKSSSFLLTAHRWSHSKDSLTVAFTPTFHARNSTVSADSLLTGSVPKGMTFPEKGEVSESKASDTHMDPCPIRGWSRRSLSKLLFILRLSKPQFDRKWHLDSQLYPSPSLALST